MHRARVTLTTSSDYYGLMTICYVALHPTADGDAGGQRVYALLLPSATTHQWDEVVVRSSKIAGAGFGVFPSTNASLSWSDLRHPVLVPYLGVETVVKDVHSQKLLLAVLRGEFERLTVAELSTTSAYVADGLFAVPQTTATPKKNGQPRAKLPPSTQLLQVVHPEAANRSRGGVVTIEGGVSSVCYLLAAGALQPPSCPTTVPLLSAPMLRQA